jgi:metal-responsive CopG/Arc/MetJ family transcriptional regulator
MSRPIKYPNTTVKSIRFPDELLKQVQDRATKRLTSFSEYVVHALQEYVK